jgi:hypothetical protein
MDGTDQARDRDSWRTIVNEVKKTSVCIKCGEFCD